LVDKPDLACRSGFTHQVPSSRNKHQHPEDGTDYRAGGGSRGQSSRFSTAGWLFGWVLTRVISDVRNRDQIWKGENVLRAWAFVVITIGLVGFSKNHALANEPAVWEALRSGGHVALLRHAIAPGTGDPAAFTIGDCSTQRNLSEQGRAQADRIGRRFRANGIEIARVFSSQWCRCRDTADLLKLGPVSEFPALNSFYQRSENRKPQTQAIKKWLSEQDLNGTHVLVTHQVNITELTGIFPSSGELVIIRPSKSGDVTVVGTIETD